MRALGILAVLATGCVTTYHGLVYSDVNGNGHRDDGERGLPHAVVAYGHTVFGETDEDGGFDLQVLDGARGVVWARVPDGYRPGPVWGITGESDEVQLGMRPLAHPISQPYRFVLASDSHVSPRQPFGNDLDGALAGMTALSSAPAFVTITGDLTQDDMDDSYDLLDGAIASSPVPYITVNGNHDWYTGGSGWFRREGPDNYSFDVGKIHYVIWNMMMPEDEIEEYLGLELAHVDPSMTVVAMSHAPPIPPIIAKLQALGVDYVLSGHTHTNRAVRHGAMTEYTTEPLLMGGLDQLPGGYRIVTVDHDSLSAVHRTTVDGAQLAVLSPTAAACVPASGARVIVAAELDGGDPAVTAAVDCGTPIELVSDGGGWSYTADLPALSPGWHTLSVDAHAPSGLAATRAVSFEVCAPATPAVPTAAWTQGGGDGSHAAASPTAVTGPLAPVWTTTVGGLIVHAPPALGDGAVFVTATDLGDGTTGGLTAIDLATGAQRWRVTTPLPVRGGAAVVGTTVAIGELDGTVLGLDTRTGQEKWRVALGAGLEPEAASFFASAAAEGSDFLLGNQRHFSAIDATTGAERWHQDPVPDGHYSQSIAAAAATSQLVVGVFHRDQGGIVAWDRLGNLKWRYQSTYSLGVEATPVISGDSVYIVDSATDVTALSTQTGGLKWTTRLRPEGFEWGQASVGAPAIANGVIVVPTMLHDLVALDATTGREKWRHAGRPSPLRTNHYAGADQAGFESGPVIAGDTVWAADTSGHLSALDLQTGALRWETDLGVPVLAGLALAGDWLIVASYDGSVRALAATTRTAEAPAPETCSATPEAPIGEDDDGGPTGAGGCCATSDGGGEIPGVPAVLLMAYAAVRRRRTR